MNSIYKLAEKFRAFPGIGNRQAQRFVYFLLTQSPEYLDELATLIKTLKKQVRSCASCTRFFSSERTATTCDLCSNANRDRATLMIVEKDIDLDNIERGNLYNGVYFVLGGAVPILEENPEERARIKQLLRQMETRSKKDGLREVILAFSATPDGDNTTEVIRALLQPHADKYSLTISVLGRGLSTGSELEYVDPNTIKSALDTRHALGFGM